MLWPKPTSPGLVSHSCFRWVRALTRRTRADCASARPLGRKGKQESPARRPTTRPHGPLARTCASGRAQPRPRRRNAGGGACERRDARPRRPPNRRSERFGRGDVGGRGAPCVTAQIRCVRPARPRAVTRETTAAVAMELRVVKPPGQDLMVERLKSRYGVGGGCPAEVRSRPACRPMPSPRVAGSAGRSVGARQGPWRRRRRRACACGEGALGGHREREGPGASARRCVAGVPGCDLHAGRNRLGPAPERRVRAGFTPKGAGARPGGSAVAASVRRPGARVGAAGRGPG